MPKNVHICGGTDYGSLTVHEGWHKRLRASDTLKDDYERDAETIFRFCEDTLCAGVFDRLCFMAEQRSVRRKLLYKRLQSLLT